MKATTAYMLIWLAVSLAVSVGIIVTGQLKPLFGLLIPLCITMNETK